MGKGLFGVLLIVPVLQIAAAPAAGAQVFNTRLTVYASVPQMRAIYLDDYGAPYKVAGNTSQNIKPKVIDAYNREVGMTQYIQKVYDQFLDSQGGKLGAGKTYTINPITINTDQNTQIITVSPEPQQLSVIL